jgi:hypothetical protein
MPAIIKPCTCIHENADKIHGKNNRVWNQMKTAPGAKSKYRCTICLKEQEF